MNRFEYYWADEIQKRPMKLPAPHVRVNSIDIDNVVCLIYKL